MSLLLQVDKEIKCGNHLYAILNARIANMRGERVGTKLTDPYQATKLYSREQIKKMIYAYNYGASLSLLEKVNDHHPR